MKKCTKCLSETMFVGQAFTEYSCQDCGEEEMHHNTGTPKRCEKCAIENNKCQYCENVWENVIKVAKYHKIKDLGNGWSMAESGPCCEQCGLKKDGKYGNMTRLCGCLNPFQLKESGGRKLCQCHIPHRAAIQKRVNAALDRIIGFAESRNAPPTQGT